MIKLKFLLLTHIKTNVFRRESNSCDSSTIRQSASDKKILSEFSPFYCYLYDHTSSIYVLWQSANSCSSHRKIYRMQSQRWWLKDAFDVVVLNRFAPEKYPTPFPWHVLTTLSFYQVAKKPLEYRLALLRKILLINPSSLDVSFLDLILEWFSCFSSRWVTFSDWFSKMILSALDSTSMFEVSFVSRVF